MKAITCKNCGASINPKTMRCEYCGTYYERDSTPQMVFRVDNTRAQVLESEVSIGSEEYRVLGDEALKFTRSMMAKSMAEAIEPNMEYEIQEDISRQRLVVRGRVRVLPPGFRF